MLAVGCHEADKPWRRAGAAVPSSQCSLTQSGGDARSMSSQSGRGRRNGGERRRCEPLACCSQATDMKQHLWSRKAVEALNDWPSDFGSRLQRSEVDAGAAMASPVRCHGPCRRLKCDSSRSDRVLTWRLCSRLHELETCVTLTSYPQARATTWSRLCASHFAGATERKFFFSAFVRRVAYRSTLHSEHHVAAVIAQCSAVSTLV